MNRTNRPMPKASTILAVLVAGIATGNAYLAMVDFAVDMVGMDRNTAYVIAGVFELSLFTVAVLAREAAKDNRPNGVLLTLTWVLSGASGLFAGIHEHDLGNGIGAILFRMTVPTLAALMWHLALIGERHLATGTTWADARRQRAMQAMYEAAEEALRIGPDGRKGRRAAARFRRARSRARRLSPPAVMIHQTQQWDAASAAETATILTARDNHARQMGAFTARQVEAPAPVAATSSTTSTDIEPTAPASVAMVRPTPVPVAAPVAVPVYAQTAATTTDTTTRVTAVVDGDRKCLGCGAPLPANASPRAKYCVKKHENGTRDRSCMNKHRAAIERERSQRATLAATVEAMTHQRAAFA